MSDEEHSELPLALRVDDGRFARKVWSRQITELAIYVRDGGASSFGGPAVLIARLPDGATLQLGQYVNFQQAYYALTSREFDPMQVAEGSEL
jgi:hypothetical protein